MADRVCSLCGRLTHLRGETHHNDVDAENHLCHNCAVNVLPFNGISDEDFLTNLTNSNAVLPLADIRRLNNIEFNHSDNDIPDNHSPLQNVDPDLNWLQFSRQQNFISDYYTENQFNARTLDKTLDPNAFSVFHLNIRSVPKHIQDLNNYLSNINVKFTILGLSETWVSNSSSGIYNMEGYDQIENYRTNRTGGGVSLYIKKNVKYLRRSDLDIFDNHLESLFVEIDKQSVNCRRNVIVGVLYRPPNTDPDAFIQSLTPLLEKLDNENKTLYLMGDFNVNLLNADTHKFTSDFIELMFSHYFMPLINKATRVTRNSTTLIDNIFCNDAHNISLFNGIFYSDISDHFPVFSVNLSSTTAKDDCTVLKGRNYSQNNINKFKE